MGTLASVVASRCLLGSGAPGDAQATKHNIRTVFIILMEDHNWTGANDDTYIFGSKYAPYINKALLPLSSFAMQNFNPPGIHPSLPNYLWLEVGTNLSILDDNSPVEHPLSATQHLVTLLKNANPSILWKAYEEDIPSNKCPLSDVNEYAPKHDTFVYFLDVTDNLNPNGTYCIAHGRPYTELATDLASSTVAQYNFITPGLCEDMHDKCKPINNPVQQADTGLQNNVSTSLNSAAFKNGGALFITRNEAADGDGPVGMVVLSPFAKGEGYNNSIYYDHGSTLRTFEEIFDVMPFLGDAAVQIDLSDLFTTFPWGLRVS